MTDHAAIARDQLRLAHDQLRMIDDAAETPGQQLLVFLAGAVVHALLEVADTLRPYPLRRVSLGSGQSVDEFEQLVEESARYTPPPGA